MKPIMCPCGLEKELIRGYAICSKHCDDVTCKGPSGGCMRCARYNATVNTRTTIEHAREQRTNG